MKDIISSDPTGHFVIDKEYFKDRFRKYLDCFEEFDDIEFKEFLLNGLMKCFEEDGE